MTNFVHSVLSELTKNTSLNSEPLVQMLVESTNKSISLGESSEKIYKSLKSGLTTVNHALKNPLLENLISQFEKNEVTPESKLASLAKEVNIGSSLSAIKLSKAYANPIIKTQVDMFESTIAKGAPDFGMSPNFVKAFEVYSYEPAVKKEVNRVKAYMITNEAKLNMLHTIFTFESFGSPIYAGVVSDLKDMLINESYTADILKIKYGNSIGLVNDLINALRIVESRESNGFTLGEGNGDTRVSNLIAPTIKIEEGMLLYADNRFIAIREAKGLTGNESKVCVDESIKITEMQPDFVKSTQPQFYAFCEALATLGFAKTGDGMGVESSAIRNFKLGFKMNEGKDFDLYLNDTKMDSLDSVNVSEAVALQSVAIKERLNLILENVETLCNLEFIKEVTNDRLLKEALVLNINEEFFVCEKVNAADRKWSKVDEFKLFELFKSNFNYDISNIFKTKIEEGFAEIKKIEEQKKSIELSISKLEPSIAKISEACKVAGLDPTEVSKLEMIKEELENKVNELKKNYIALDIYKKKELV